MFRSSTIIRELALNLAKIMFMLKIFGEVKNINLEAPSFFDLLQILRRFSYIQIFIWHLVLEHCVSSVHSPRHQLNYLYCSVIQ